jgi:hypothetical protein
VSGRSLERPFHAKVHWCGISTSDGGWGRRTEVLVQGLPRAQDWIIPDVTICERDGIADVYLGVEASESESRKRLTAILRATPPLMRVLSVARRLCLPDWLVFSGAVPSGVWLELKVA